MSKELEHLVQVGSLEFGGWWLQLRDKLKPKGRKNYADFQKFIHSFESMVRTQLAE